MPTKTLRMEATNRLEPTLERMLVDAIDCGLKQSVGAMTARMYVDVRTMPPFELGLRFKRALRDELYERRRGERRRTAALKAEKDK